MSSRSGTPRLILIPVLAVLMALFSGAVTASNGSRLASHADVAVVDSQLAGSGQAEATAAEAEATARSGRAGDASDDRLDEAQLAKRVKARWAALSKGDFAEAYRYETPGYRATVTLRQFRSQFGSAVHWRGAEVQHLDVSETGDRAVVQVLLEYEAPTPVGDTYVNRRPLKERWIASEGDWWHVRD